MIVKKTEQYTSIQPSLKEDHASKNKLDFAKEFSENYINFKDVNLILDFSNNINIELEEILLLSRESGYHKNNNKSFVIVYPIIDIERMPNDLIVVPTFQEAIDVIEIEEIERDLGI